MSEPSTAVDLVTEVIQRVYGDATQTVLDQKAASEILDALRSAGWASLDEIAILIEAAGGEIVVPHRLAFDFRERRVAVQDDYATPGRKFTVVEADR